MAEQWRELPVGTWFFLDSPDCVERYSVQERTSGGATIVCSTPYIHERAKRDMQEIAKAHSAQAIREQLALCPTCGTRVRADYLAERLGGK